jgi:hypothetical protein
VAVVADGTVQGMRDELAVQEGHMSNKLVVVGRYMMGRWNVQQEGCK